MPISALEFAFWAGITGVVSGMVSGVLIGAADEIESIPLLAAAVIGFILVMLFSHFAVNWPTGSLELVYSQRERGVVVLSSFAATLSFVASVGAGYSVERAIVRRGGLQNALSYYRHTTRRVFRTICAETASDFRAAWNATIYGEYEED